MKPPPAWRGPASAALLATLTVVTFWPALGFGFVYDDDTLILRNPALHSLAGLREAFTRGVWHFDPYKGDAAGGYYRPLVNSLLTLSYQVFGERPAGYHGLSLALHLTAGGLVLRLGRALTLSLPASTCAAALFLLHPIQIQAVAWPSAVGDPLLAVFVLAATLTWLAWLRFGAKARLLVCLVCCTAALLTLERGVLIGVGLMTLALHARALSLPSAAAFTPRQHALALASLLAPCALALSLRRWAIGPGLLPTPPDLLTATLHAAPLAGLQYLHNLIHPVQLSLAYPIYLRPHAALGATALHWLACVVILAALLGLSLRSARRRVLLASAIAALSPALGVGALPSFAVVQDRYLYTAMAFVALWLADLAWSTAATLRAPVRRLFAAALGVWAAALYLPHASNLACWRDEVALYTRAVSLAPDNAHMLMNLSNSLARSGTPVPECRMLWRSLELLGLDPGRGSAELVELNLANCLRDHGHARQALTHYDRALQITGGRLLPAGINRVITLAQLGDLAEAERAAQRVVRTDPESAHAWQTLGVVRAQARDPRGAAEAFERALRLDPDDRASRRMLESLPR